MTCRVVPREAMGTGLYNSVSITHSIWAAPRKEGMTLNKCLSSTKGNLQNEIYLRSITYTLSSLRKECFSSEEFRGIQSIPSHSLY